MIAGPTAVGKTDCALTIANHFNTEIISGDSRQVYKEMEIGTAAPDAGQLAEVKHHMIGNRSIHEYYNVSMYEQEVMSALATIFTNNDKAVITGGSGLYLDVVERGIDELPDIDPLIRQKLKDEYVAKGLDWLQSEVSKIDPEYFAIVDRKNPNRLLRALETHHTTGLKYSTLRKSKLKQRYFKTIRTGLVRPKEELIQIINNRVDDMIERGLVEECRRLYPLREINALNTVGYKEIFSHLSGEMSLDEAIEKIKTNTRRYAKRQLTWFRRDPKTRWFHPDDTSRLIVYVEEEISKHLRKAKIRT